MNKKILIVFALFAVLFGAHLFLKANRSGREQPPAWQTPKLEGLTKVEIVREGDTIVLEKSATVVLPPGASKIKALLDRVVQANSTAPPLKVQLIISDYVSTAACVAGFDLDVCMVA